MFRSPRFHRSALKVKRSFSQYDFLTLRSACKFRRKTEIFVSTKSVFQPIESGGFSSGRIRLFNADCFAFLPSIPPASVDLVLIDPPYEVSRDTNFQSGKATGKNTDRFRVSMDFGTWDNGFTGLDTVIREAYRILKNGGTLICFYDVWKITVLKRYFENAGFKQLRLIEWIKTNPVPLNSKTNYLTNAREIAVSGVKKSKPTFNSLYDDGIYKYPICHDKGRFHPTQKPLALIERLILKHSNAEDTILDCFFGSGTTAVAACNTGRRFIGCEISKEYCQKAVKRLQETCPPFQRGNNADG